MKLALPIAALLIMCFAFASAAALFVFTLGWMANLGMKKN